MKRLIFALMLITFMQTVYAGVNITCTQVGETNEIQVSYAMDAGDANLPRLFALDIAADNGATIDTITYTDPCFWVYLGTIQISGGTVTSWGTPVAPSADPCALGGLGTGGITIEMGSLYSADDPNHTSPPASSGALLSFRVSSDCNVVISENDIRCGVTLEDTTRAATNLPTSLVLSTECYTGPDYTEWAAVGKPNSWCYPKQCHGDATGSDEQFGRGTWVSVGFQDLQVLLGGYNDPVYVNPTVDPWIAADFTHSQEQFGRGTYVHVGFQDFQVLLEYYNDPCSTVPGNCLGSP